MIGLSDNQLRIAMAAAGALPPALRARFLELMVVHLRGVYYPRDAELGNAVRLAMQAIERNIGDAAISSGRLPRYQALRTRGGAPGICLHGAYTGQSRRRCLFSLTVSSC